MAIRHAHGRIVVKVDMNYKDSHQFEDGTKIKLVRRVDNFDMKHTQPVNAIVLSAEHIPQGAEIIIHHNSTHDSNRIFNYKPLSGKEVASDIKYFSIPELEAYLWRMPGEEWQPVKGFATGLRVFEPYNGILQGIPPKQIKDTLLITSGALKGKVVMTLKSCDYCLVFQDNGRERNIIRIRHDDDTEIEREEVQLIHNEMTTRVNKGELLIGLTPTDAKPINELQYV